MDVKRMFLAALVLAVLVTALTPAPGVGLGNPVPG
jgi:hypothetical protein